MKKPLKRLLCAAVALLMSLPSAANISAFAASTERTSGIADGYSVDFSNEESDYNVTVPPSELLSAVCADVISTAEAEYLDAYFETAFIYSPDVSAENVSVTCEGEQICISAREKSYTAQNGTEIVWRPYSALYGSNTKELTHSGDAYVCTFGCGTEQTVTVKYKCEIALPSEYISKLAEFARSDALKSADIRAEYSQALEEYLNSVEKYENYLLSISEYENALAAYEEYVKELEIYKKSLDNYNAYLAALSAYGAELAAYEKYIDEYEKYLIAEAEYEKSYSENQAEYENYRRYLENLNKIRASTAYIESLFTIPSNGVGTLFNALQNKELVSMIEKYDDELVSFYGVKREDIDVMRTVSDELNVLLHGYSDARDISEEAAFAFYKENYAEITQKFKYLYDKMSSILTPTIFVHICAWIEIEYKNDPDMAVYKKWRIRNVLCHIYLVCRGLDDEVTADGNWSFYTESGKKHTYAFSELLGQNIIIADTDSACPDRLEWWSGEIPAANLPKAPVRPAEVMKPTEPIAVSKPTEPQSVPDPGNAPDPVEAPGTRPSIDGYDLLIRTQQYFGSDIPNTHTLSGVNTVSFTADVERAFSFDGSQINSYYTFDGKLLPDATEPTVPPERSSTAQYSYSFDGWKSVSVCDGYIFYPKYISAKRSYTVVFKSSDGARELYTCECEYGEIPVFNAETPQKASTNMAVYTFDGWYPAIAPIKGQTEYIAQFSESTRVYTVKWNILGNITEYSFTYGSAVTMPTVKQTRYIGGYLYTFKGWDKSAATVTESTEYTALFDKTELASVPNGKTAELEIYDSGTSLTLTTDTYCVEVSELLKYAADLEREITVVTRFYTLRLTSEAINSLLTYRAKTLCVLSSDNGVGYTFKSGENEIHFSGKVGMSLLHGFYDTYGTYICRDGESDVSCSVSGEYAEFYAQPSSLYSVKQYRSLTLEVGENGAAFADGHFYRAGDTVTLRILPNAEYTADKITMTDENGTVTELTGQSTFVMPNSNVKISVEFTPKKYTVSFVCNGETVSSELYSLGEAIVIPDIPLSFEKDGFLYSFIGWSEPISVVTGDAVFTAKYFSVKTELAEKADTQTAVDKVLKSQLLPAVICLALTVGAVIGITVPLAKAKKAKKKSERTKKEQ